MDATVADPVIGRLLDGRYTAQERIAVGGMATVYIAHDNRLDRFVALKIMHPNLGHDPDFVARFHREATAVARLSTPRVVSVLDQGSDRTPAGILHYLVMELVRGRSLRDYLGVRGRLSVPEVIEIFEPVTEALAAAHATGIIHRDIKPENILLGDDGQVKVADFGLARPLSQPTQAMTGGGVMGTVGYLAPEQVTHGAADTRSDVYAAGVMLFEMLTGQLPHTGATPMSVAYQSVHGDVPAPSTVVPGVPRELDNLVTRATARDPRHRPVDGIALLHELRQIMPYLPQPEDDEEYHSGFTGPFPRVEPPPRHAGAGSHQHHGAPAPTSVIGTMGGRRRSDRGSAGRLRVPTGPAVVAGVVVLCLVLGVLAVRALLGSGGPEVPKLIGLTQERAEADLREVGLVPEYGDPVPSEIYDEGTVVEQSPSDGAPLKEGAIVTLRLSSGPPKVAVPDLANQPVIDAQSALTGAGLALGGSRTEAHDTIPNGSVISTEPAAGTELSPGDKVNLIVSSGPSSAEIPEDIIGMSYEEAKAAIEGLALNITVERQEIRDDDVDPGQVARTSPDPGQRVNAGGTVTLFVARGDDDDVGGDGSGIMITVPNVVGKSYTEAERILRRVGLRAWKANWFGDEVVEQSPKAGKKLERGSAVRLRVEW